LTENNRRASVPERKNGSAKTKMAPKNFEAIF